MSIGITYEQFCFKRGDTFNLNLQLVDMDETLQYPPDDVRRAIDLTGYTFTSQVKALADGAAGYLDLRSIKPEHTEGMA